MIYRLEQSLSFEVHQRSPRMMTSVLTSVSRSLNCEFTPVDRADLADAYITTLFGIQVVLGVLPDDDAGATYVVRGSTGGPTDVNTEYLDLSPHVASLLAGPGRWEPIT